ncbi:helix-turn-helix domain-containing protein [Lachnospiraceae bacterium WCA-9-b2]|jgi:transcriptional regulator with XRE-family HTH domain|uniref:Helix-turn-helix domain-containing protein n=1 Tax=Sporofaciens musculi TaxID=2681861 RepID=A0A7X3SID0_9FIRM|nr:helix-turn-helix domain-containing protein [Sporofaciens musculi]MCI9423817.1 helix-turn-helix transcriptional regulator [Dorea sp.]MXP75295.1 helix-turn-helix domain-containing protein [Sporofaciens musculi]
MRYPVISVERTGKRIRDICVRQGICAKEIQEYMGFSAVQSVYDWFHGKNLPSVDNLYALSRLLKVSMERLLVTSDQEETGRVCELMALPRKDSRKMVMWYREGIKFLSISL